MRPHDGADGAAWRRPPAAPEWGPADSTPAERQGLLAVLRRFPAAPTGAVREVLERRANRRRLVVGGLPHRP